MSIEFRPAQPEEMREFARVGQVAFGSSTADAAVEREMRWPVQPQWTLCAFDGGVMGAKMATLPFLMCWGGRDIHCGGVSAVGTLPSHRRRGLLRELMSRAFQTMREHNQPVAMLWASMAAIYQRFGYGMGFSGSLYDFDPRELRFVDAMRVPGRVRLYKAEQALPLLEGVYRRFMAPRTLMLHRADRWQWDGFVLDTWGEGPPPLIAVYEEAGEALGYAPYTVSERTRQTAGPSQQALVRELAWLTPAAHRGLIEYFAGYDLADSIRILRVPVDDPLFHQVQEPRLLKPRMRDGTLVRIVDIVPALEGRGYTADGALVLEVSDDLCPWNSGCWELTVEGGAGRVKPAGRAPDLRLGPRALAVLASGHQSATMLARGGMLVADDPGALRTADAIFRTAYAPLCFDGF
jgi:predicted acetyltransferase